MQAADQGAMRSRFFSWGDQPATPSVGAELPKFGSLGVADPGDASP
jgi:hypothetical protein